LVGLAEYQVLAPPHCHPMIVRLRDRLRRARLHARPAEDALAKIERDRLIHRSRDGTHRANGYTVVTFIGAFCGVNAQRAAVAIRQHGRWSLGIRHGLATAFQTMKNGVERKHGQRSKPQ
jgi:hypothetical protein